MGIKIKIPEGGYKLPLIPPAVYRLRVGTPKQKTSPETGNISLNWESTVLSEGPDPKIKTTGRKAFINTTLTEKSMWNLDALLRAATGQGFPENKEFTIEELIAYVIPKISGKDIIAKCHHEKAQNSDDLVERWGDYKKVG